MKSKDKTHFSFTAWYWVTSALESFVNDTVNSNYYGVFALYIVFVNCFDKMNGVRVPNKMNNFCIGNESHNPFFQTKVQGVTSMLKRCFLHESHNTEHYFAIKLTDWLKLGSHYVYCWKCNIILSVKLYAFSVTFWIMNVYLSVVWIWMMDFFDTFMYCKLYFEL